MKTIIFLIFALLITMITLSCNDNLDSFLTKTEIIPQPTINTIAFISKDGYLHISNDNYTKAYRISIYFASEHDWSPDKQWLCYEQDFKIWKIKYDGSSKIQLTPSIMKCELPQFSPDGGKIVFVAVRPGYTSFITDIYTMESSGNNIQKITSNSLISTKSEYSFSWPDWLRNGNQIIFQYFKVEKDPTKVQRHLAIFELTTQNFTTLHSLDNLHPFQPHPSPTRDEFLFVSLVSLEYGGTDIYRAKIDGTDITKLTNNKRSWLPDWSSDGEKFIYNFTKENRIRTMRIMNREGANDYQLTIAGEDYGMGPNW